MTPSQHLAAAMRAARVLLPAPPRDLPVVAEPTEPWDSPVINELDLPLPDLLRLMAVAHGVSTADMRAELRRADLVEARSEFCYRAARRLGVSSVVIGNAICRDHTTVRHAIGRYCERHGLPSPCGKVDYAEERRRRIARSKAGYRRLADRLTMEQEG